MVEQNGADESAAGRMLLIKGDYIQDCLNYHQACQPGASTMI
jgi:hypothetical protein